MESLPGIEGVPESVIAYFADDGFGFAPHPHEVKETFGDSPAPATRPAIILNRARVYGDIAQAGDLGRNTGPTLNCRCDCRCLSQIPPA